MNLTLIGGTGQQRQWFEEALRRITYPLDSLEVNVTVTWPVEPSLPGHREFACTSTPDGINFALEIRESLDTSTMSDYSGRLFYEETVVHEMAHVITFAMTTTEEREALTPMFYKTVQGEGLVRGTAPDLNPADKDWGDRIQETMAEVVKDAIMPSTYRDYDNRTNWLLDKAQYEAFMHAIYPTGTGGAGGPTETVRDSGSWTPHYYYRTPSDRLHVDPEVALTSAFADHLTPLDPADGEVGAKVRFRWYIPDDNEILGGAVLYYDIRATTVADPSVGVSLIGGLDIGPFPETGLQVEVHPGDEGLIEFDYPELPLPGGFDVFMLRCYISGAIHGPGGSTFSGWYQTSTFEPGATPPIEPPPWPYTDPFVTAGGGDTMVFRAL